VGLGRLECKEHVRLQISHPTYAHEIRIGCMVTDAVRMGVRAKPVLNHP